MEKDVEKKENNRNEKMGKFIAEMRKANGLTQKDLAKQLGVTDKAVSKWERAASSPDIDLLIPLANILGVSAGELLNGEKTIESAEKKEEDMVREALEEPGSRKCSDFSLSCNSEYSS